MSFFVAREPARASLPVWRGPVLTLASQYSLASLLVLLVGGLLTGWWVGTQIRQGVIHRTAATTALYVENFLVLHLQELGRSAWLPPGRVAAIQELLATPSLRKEIVSVKIWAPGGRVVYGENAGQTFAVDKDQQQAWEGTVSSDITDLQSSENVSQRGQFDRLIETYAPMRLEGSERVIAVAEFYQTVGPLEREIARAQRQSWLVVGLTTLLTYLALSGLVRRGSNTIGRQQVRLQAQVITLEHVLAQNEELHGRVSRAAARHAAHSERFLRRVSSDLHDGPAQDLSFALLRLESLSVYAHLSPGAEDTLRAVEQSLESALKEMRAIATDLRLPDLAPLNLRATLERVIRDHGRRSGDTAVLSSANLPDEAPLSVKFTAFRIVQEALNNAHRHARSAGPVTVWATVNHDTLILQVCDCGPGFSWSGEVQDGHLGLEGMRERAEGLGGEFAVRRREPGPGTCAEARLPLRGSRLPQPSVPDRLLPGVDHA